MKENSKFLHIYVSLECPTSIDICDVHTICLYYTYLIRRKGQSTDFIQSRSQRKSCTFTEEIPTHILVHSHGMVSTDTDESQDWHQVPLQHDFLSGRGEEALSSQMCQGHHVWHFKTTVGASSWNLEFKKKKKQEES